MHKKKSVSYEIQIGWLINEPKNSGKIVWRDKAKLVMSTICKADKKLSVELELLVKV